MVRLALMEAFLRNIVSFPTAPLTVCLGIVVLYWLFALVTGAGVDGADGAADAVAGGVKGSGDAVAGALKGAGGGAEHAAEAGASLHDGGLLGFLGIGRIPVTMIVSLTVLGAWSLTTGAVALLHPESVLLQSALLLGAVVLGFFATALLLRPFGRALAQARPARSRDALGQLCTITSGKVDAGFGTAVVDDGGAGLNVMVVCAKPNALKKGDRALLVDLDRATGTYEVEPVEWLLPEELQALEDPSRAPSVLSSRVRQR